MNLKKFVPFAIGIVGIILTSSCKKDEDAKSREESLEDFVESLQVPPQPEIPAVNTDSFFTEKTPNEICSYREYNAGASFDESFVLDPTIDVIYPGALIDGATLTNGSYAPLNIARGPITIYTQFMNKEEDLFKTIENPNGATVAQAIKELLYDDNINGATEARVNFEVKEIVDKDQLDLELGVSVNLKKADFTEKFNFNDSSSTRNFLIKYIQPMYHISIVPPTRPSDLFAKDITKEDLEKAVKGNSMPCYIGNVTYGRAVYALMQTEEKSSKIANELKASFDAFIDGKTDTKIETFKNSSSYTFSGTIIGGNANMAAKGIKSIDDILEYITSDANFSKENPAGMLSYKLNKISDNSTYTIKKAANYTIKNCETFNGSIRLEAIESLSSEHDGGDDLEPYGDIKIHLNGTTYTIFTLLNASNFNIINGKKDSISGSGNNASIGGVACTTGDGPELNLENVQDFFIGINFTEKDNGNNPDDPFFTFSGTKYGEEGNVLVGYTSSISSITNRRIQESLDRLKRGASHEERFFVDIYRVYNKKSRGRLDFYDNPETLRLHFVINLN